MKNRTKKNLLYSKTNAAATTIILFSAYLHINSVSNAHSNDNMHAYTLSVDVMENILALLYKLNYFDGFISISKSVGFLNCWDRPGKHALIYRQSFLTNRENSPYLSTPPPLNVCFSKRVQIKSNTNAFLMPIFVIQKIFFFVAFVTQLRAKWAKLKTDIFHKGVSHEIRWKHD